MQPLAELETDAFLKAHQMPADTRVWDVALKDAWLAEFYDRIPHQCTLYDRFWYMTLFFRSIGGVQTLDLFSPCVVGDSGRVAPVRAVFVM
jgi:hypothetical protein